MGKKKFKFNKKNQRNLVILIIILLSVIFPEYYKKYFDFHAWENLRIEEISINNIAIDDKIDEFTLDKIEELEETDLFVWNKDYLNKIVEKINNAKSRIYLQTYIFTEKRIKSALKKAYDRGVEVKIILEQNVYKAPKLNNKVFYELKKYWIDMKWASRDFALTHAKFFVIDNEIIMSTGNISYSTFSKNRDFFIETSDTIIVKVLERIFENDFIWKREVPYKHEVVLSPTYSREKLEELINTAKNNINMYSQNFSDKNISDLLVKKSKSWIKINMIAPSLSKMPNNEEVYIKLRKAWINIIEKTNPYIHAKALEIDNKFLLIWSINYSSYSIDKNREVSLIIKNPELIKKFEKIFNQDLK